MLPEDKGKVDIQFDQEVLEYLKESNVQSSTKKTTIDCIGNDVFLKKEFFEKNKNKYLKKVKKIKSKAKKKDFEKVYNMLVALKMNIIDNNIKK